MGIAHDAVRAVGRAMQSFHAGPRTLVSREIVGTMAPRLLVKSPAFVDGAPLPLASTVDGAGTPPTIEWSGVPMETKSLALVCEDPDALFPDPFVHWIVYGIPTYARSLDGRTPLIAKRGKNGKRATGFAPAAPPLLHGVHHYHVQVFALDVPTDLPPGLGRGALVDHMRGHVLAWGEIVGTNERT